MSYRIRTMDKPPRVIVVVGVGGTGTFVAEGICRLTRGMDILLLLIDPDRVEERNLIRQDFYPGDLGKFKARVVADRLAARYGRRVAFSITPFSADILQGLYGSLEGKTESFGQTYPSGRYEDWDLIIGCTDNPGARDDLAHSIMFPSWWIDAGNGDNSGQVFIGNASKRMLADSFIKEETDTPGEVVRLPLPTIVEPGLLAAVPEPVPDLNCAEAVEQNIQSPLINQAMSWLVQEFVYRLISGKLTWMSAYIDSDLGSLRAIDISPSQVAKIMSVKESSLWKKVGKPKESDPYCHNFLDTRTITAQQFVDGNWEPHPGQLIGVAQPGEENEEEEENE